MKQRELQFPKVKWTATMRHEAVADALHGFEWRQAARREKRRQRNERRKDKAAKRRDALRYLTGVRMTKTAPRGGAARVGSTNGSTAQRLNG